MTVYLIHFTQPYKHARHYIGFSGSLDSMSTRLTAHACGRGARFMEVIHEAGIPWRVARVWDDGDRFLEVRLKRRHGAARFCPLCRQERKEEARI